MAITRLTVWARWLFLEIRAFWLWLGVLFVAGIFVWLCPWGALEARSRWAGTALQLLGFGLTAIGIGQTRKQFGRPGIFESAARWIARRPKRNTTIHVATGAMAASVMDAVLAVGHTRAPPGSSLEQRVQRLEEWLPLIEQRASGIEGQLNNEKGNRAQNDAEEKAAREAADTNLLSRLELTATGGLRLSVVGLLWLVFGTILAGFAPEIAGADVTPHAVYPLRVSWQAAICSAYFAIAIGFSLFYGLKAIDIFTDTDAKLLTSARLFHQRWLNFLGSATGWVCLWFVATKVWHQVSNGSDPAIGWSYAALAVVAFVGVSGFLPFTVVTLVNSVGRVVGKIAGLFKPGD